MAKKRSWFNLVRKLFISETECPQEKKDERRKWVFFGRLKVKSRLASISGPIPSPPRERSTLSEAEEEQSKRALDVALATAAAAEAAVAAAQAAAEVVLLHSTHQSEKQLKAEEEGEEEKHSAMKTQYDREKQAIAAIKIQSTFRGYLARKALRALKGIVKLQAIIRGRNVRRQAMNTLKCLQSIVNIQSQVCAKRIQMAEGTCYCDKHSHSSSDKIIKMDTSSQKRWDGSILTKEEADALFVSKKEAALKRERIKEYSFNHRNSAETERNKSNGRWRYWLEQWVDTQLSKSKEAEDLDIVMTSNPKPRVEYCYRGKQIKLRNADAMEGIDSNSPIGIAAAAAAPPRRSFHRKQNSLGEENSNSLSRSPVIPAYMAATESAKAKAVRSMSSPKLRSTAATAYDAFSDTYSPFKNKLSLLTSTATARYGKQTSPSLKALPASLKSNLALNHLSFDSQCSFRTWDHHTNFP